MTAGQRIKAERERLGLTQDELAKKLGYSNRSAVTRIETSPDLSLKKVRRCAEALGVTSFYLLGWEDRDGNSLVDEEVETDSNSESVKDINRKLVRAYEYADDLTQAMVRKLLGIE